MQVGNDVVDLQHPENLPGAVHPRFDERVFCPVERDRLNRHADPLNRHRLRWVLWAAKESSLKLFRKSYPDMPFHPRDFRVELDEELRHGVVLYGDETSAVDIDVDDERVHVIAMTVPGGNVVAGVARLDPLSPRVASEEVRRRAARAVRSMLGSTGVTIVGGLDPDVRSGSRVPGVVGASGHLLPVDLSLSHDGAWIAFAAAHK